MKTYYELLSVEPSATAEDVKRAFRREIARYHPDKVQHLGPEFQEIAATRAAALTEAYRVLMDGELRRSYDQSIADGSLSMPPMAPEPVVPPRSPTDSPPPVRPAPVEEPAPAPSHGNQFHQTRATTSEFLRRAALAKVKEAIDATGGVPTSVAGFEAAYLIQGRRGLFKKPEPDVRLLVRVVPLVDAASVQEAWAPALRAAAAASETSCLLLLGSGFSSARELSTAVAEQRRRSRQNGPVVVPVDMRDWEALFPPEAPMVVRSLLDRLRQGH